MANENLIKYSLKAELVEKLRSLALENESPSLVAKRFLLESLGYSQEAVTPDIPPGQECQIIKQLADHEARLQALESTDLPIVRFLNKSSKED